jgi:hypothetical protein
MADEENGDVIDTEERPMPPPRTDSLPLKPIEERYLEIIKGSIYLVGLPKFFNYIATLSFNLVLMVCN